MLAGWSAFAIGQHYPTKPIRVIVPQPPGGSTDLVARPLAKHFTETFGQSVIVENRPGAGSVIRTDQVAKASPDGYTLLMVAASFTINPSLHKQLPFDPVNDFTPVSLPLVAAEPARRSPLGAGEIGEGANRPGEGQAR